MSQELANKLKKEFEDISNIKCRATFMEKGKKHIPTILSNNQKGVYIFFLTEKICFKVGKADKKTKARWNSQHYCLDKTTPSTLTKSFLSDIEKFKQYFDKKQQIEIDEFKKILDQYVNQTKDLKDELKLLDKSKVKELSEQLNLKDWIINNMSRIEILLSENESKFDLNLLEALVQFRLKPIYEGKIPNKTQEEEQV